MKILQAPRLTCLNVGLCGTIAAGIQCFLLSYGYGQQAQTQTIPPVQSLNSQYVQGVAPGYYPTAGAGLTLNLGPGTSFCNGSLVYYAGGTLTMVASATNYVYLEGWAACAPAVNSSGFPASSIPIAVVAASSSGITSIADGRTWFTTGVASIFGSLGVGVASPSDRLEVSNGNVRADTGYFFAVRAGITQVLLGGSGSRWGDLQNDQASTWSLGYKSGSNLALGTPVLTWTTANRVGIGNLTSPAQTLDVNGSGRFALNTVSSSATPAFDASLGNTQLITLTGNVTSSTLVKASAGEFLYFIVCQDATGGRTFAWPANLKGGMTIGATAGTCSAQAFIFNGNNAYALAPGVANQ